MAIEALKASQAAAQAQPDAAQPAEPPAPAQPPVEHPAAQEPPAQPAAQEPPAASGPASHTAWREAVPAFVPEAPAAQPGPAPEPEAAQPAAAPEPSPAPAAQGAQAAGAASPSAAPAKRSHKLRNACIALACALLVMAGLLAGAWLGLFRLPDPVQERLYLLPDPHAQAGTLNASASGASPGGFQLVLNQLCAMGEGSLDCPIEFENPESNQYSARISLEVDGQEVARSGMVAPGAYLSTVRLDGALEPGDHEARAVVRVYSGATQALTLSNSVTVRVG